MRLFHPRNTNCAERFKRPLALCLVVVLLAILPACSTAPGGTSLWRPGTWFQGRAAAAQAKAEVREGQLGEQATHVAHVEIAKTKVFLDVAKNLFPDSRPVQLASRTTDNAYSLLNQVNPLSAAELADAEALAQGLLAAKREAEDEQARAEAHLRSVSTDLEKVRAKLKELDAKAAGEAQENLRLANELRNQTFLKWAGFSLSTLFGLAAFAYKLNLGNFKVGAADALKNVREKHGDEAADTLTTALDSALTRSQQGSVAKALFALTAK